MDGRDKRVWLATTDGKFSCLWKYKAPLRVIAFGWLALQSGILTYDNLRRRKHIMVNACPMFLADAESFDHLLLNCKYAYVIVLNLIGCYGPLPNS